MAQGTGTTGWRAWLELLRPRLAAFVGVSAASGFVLAAGFEVRGLLPALACLVLAAGASALNQYQEWKLDARMERTARRPLPTGRVRPRAARRLAWVLIAVGGLLLAATGRGATILLGALAIVLYNGCYTPLKRVTAFAAVPGALIGCLGPAIGWLAAGPGGAPGAAAPVTAWTAPGVSSLAALMIVMYLWQVPHFWVLQIRHDDGYHRAGFPTLMGRLGRAGGARVLSAWTVSALAAPLLLPLFGSIRAPWACGLLLLSAVGAGSACAGLVVRRPLTDRVLRRGFAGINGFVLATLILIMVDRGLRP
jgi:heme o synthase